MRKILVIILILVLVLSIGFNYMLFQKGANSFSIFTFYDANTRETYETVHNIKEAQKVSTGKGIKVGILDKYFGFAKHNNLYAGGLDFTDNPNNFKEIDEHGYWMAITLKEIAPDVEIYALNARAKDKTSTAKAIAKAIDWAIENDIDVLTYSAGTFGQENKEIIDNAVKRAIENNIVTTFIHYPYTDNILPYAFLNYREGEYARKPDLSIYHYDYNALQSFTYNKYIEKGRKPKSGNDIPYFSFSSMSPVLAGIVAMMKEVDNTLAPSEYKRILIETSKEFEYKGKIIEKVVDAPAALNFIKEMNPEE